MRSSRSVPSRFSTSGREDSERIARWQAHHAQAFGDARVRTLGETPFAATEIGIELDELRFACIVASPHLVERDTRRIALTPTGGVALRFAVHGESFFYSERAVRVQRPGELLIHDLDRPYSRGVALGLTELVMTMPRGLFESITNDEVGRAPLVVDFTDAPGASRQARGLAELLGATLSSGDVDRGSVERTALARLRSLFAVDESRATAEYRRVAIEYMERNLRDPRLGVKDIARAAGISSRHLTRVFTETGAGISALVREKRLELAHRLLTSGHAPSVAGVAAQCGFASHTHFTRVFHERYGQTPASLRASARLTAV